MYIGWLAEEGGLAAITGPLSKALCLTRCLHITKLQFARRQGRGRSLCETLQRSLSEIVLGNEQLGRAGARPTKHYRKSKRQSERIGIKTSHLRLASSLGAIS